VIETEADVRILKLFSDLNIAHLSQFLYIPVYNFFFFPVSVHMDSRIEVIIFFLFAKVGQVPHEAILVPAHLHSGLTTHILNSELAID
jgi:hypothetical protein